MFRNPCLALLLSVLLVIVPSASTLAREGGLTTDRLERYRFFADSPPIDHVAVFEIEAGSSSDVWHLRERRAGSTGFGEATFYLRTGFSLDGFTAPAIEHILAADPPRRLDLELGVGMLAERDGEEVAAIVLRTTLAVAGNHEEEASIATLIEIGKSVLDLEEEARALAEGLRSEKPFALEDAERGGAGIEGSACREQCRQTYKASSNWCVLEAGVRHGAVSAAALTCVANCPLSGPLFLWCEAACMAAWAAGAAVVAIWFRNCSRQAERDRDHCYEKCTGIGPV